jgi:hypothetical protein
MTETLTPPVTEPDAPEPEKFSWRRVVIASVVGFAVVMVSAFGIRTAYRTLETRNLARQEAAMRVAQAWVKTHAVIVRPWVNLPGPGATQILAGPPGAANAYSSTYGTISFIAANGHVVQRQLLKSPPGGLAGLGFAMSDTAAYAYTREHSAIARVPLVGSPDLTWAPTKGLAWWMGSTSSGDLIVLFRTRGTKRTWVLQRVSKDGRIAAPYATLGPGTVFEPNMAVAHDGTVYLAWQGSSAISKVSPSGHVTKTWSTLRATYPKGAPAAFRQADEFVRQFGLRTTLAVAPDGSVFASSTYHLFHVSTDGRVERQWLLGDVDGYPGFIPELAVGQDGTIYTNTVDGPIAKLQFPSASS